MKTQHLRDTLALYTHRLRQSGSDTPALDAALLIGHVLGQSRTYVLTHPEISLAPDQAQALDYLAKRREEQEPMAYLLGRCEFMSLDFATDARALIPRPDTETLAQAAIDHIQVHEVTQVLDLCTGSGCVALSVAHYCPEVHVKAVDVCPDALDLAKENAQALCLADRVSFVQGDIFTNFCVGMSQLLLSNPPYIQRNHMTNLPSSVANYEPSKALDGGADGLSFYRRIAQIAPRLLEPSSTIFLEMGHDQADALRRIFADYENIRIHKDLPGHHRVFEAQLW